MHDEVENEGMEIANKDHADDAGDDTGGFNFAIAHDATGHIIADPAVIFEY